MLDWSGDAGDVSDDVTELVNDGLTVKEMGGLTFSDAELTLAVGMTSLDPTNVGAKNTKYIIN